MRHQVFAVKGQVLSPVGFSDGRHPLEAVKHYRRQAKYYTGQLVAKRVQPNVPARTGIVTPLTMDGDMRLSKLVVPSANYYDMRKPEAREAWASRESSYAAECVRTSELLGK
jgi:hypothetical protein